MDLMSGKKGVETPPDYFFYGTTAVLYGDWKYHSKGGEGQGDHGDSKGPTLYNLKDDIGESKHVIDQYPEIATRRKAALESNPNQKPKQNGVWSSRKATKENRKKKDD